MTAVKAAVQSSKLTVVACGGFSIAHSSDVVPDCTAILTPGALRLSTVLYPVFFATATPWLESI